MDEDVYRLLTGDPDSPCDFDGLGKIMNATRLHLFERCKSNLIDIIITRIQPACSGCFDGIDQLIDEFEEKVRALELEDA